MLQLTNGSIDLYLATKFDEPLRFCWQFESEEIVDDQDALAKSLHLDKPRNATKLAGASFHGVGALSDNILSVARDMAKAPVLLDQCVPASEPHSRQLAVSAAVKQRYRVQHK